MQALGLNKNMAVVSLPSAPLACYRDGLSETQNGKSCAVGLQITLFNWETACGCLLHTNLKLKQFMMEWITGITLWELSE